MLSQKIKRKKDVISICESSGDIKRGDSFVGIRFANQDDDFADLFDSIICCGKVRDDELLFRSGDGRYYFSIKDGWGEQNGVLYGLKRGICFDFNQQTTENDVIAECESFKDTYHTWGGAMLYHSKKTTLDTIVSTLLRNRK